MKSLVELFRSKHNSVFRHSNPIYLQTQNSLGNLFSAVTRSSIVSKSDKTGKITFVNENFERISGYSKHELLGKYHNIINSGYHTKMFWSNVWRSIANGTPWRGEVCNRAKDGRIYWVDTFIYPFYDSNGLINEYFSIRNDITQRKAQEEALSKSANLLRSVFNSTKDVYILLDKDFSLLSANAQAEQLLTGKNVEERLFEFISIQPDFSGFLESALNGNNVDKEILLNMLDGAQLWYHVRCTPAYKNKGTLLGVALNLTNIHARKIQELALLKQNKALSEIAWFQSHEIRRPVASILGLMQLLENDSTDSVELLYHLKKMVLELDMKTKDIVRLSNESEFTFLK